MPQIVDPGTIDADRRAHGGAYCVKTQNAVVAPKYSGPSLHTTRNSIRVVAAFRFRIRAKPNCRIPDRTEIRISHDIEKDVVTTFARNVVTPWIQKSEANEEADFTRRCDRESSEF
jgi:hypothetical protein